MKALILLGVLAGGTLFAQDAVKPAATPTPPPAIPTTPSPAQTGTNAPKVIVDNRDPRFQRMMDARAMRDLTPEQQTKLQEANEAYTKMVAPLEERLLRTRGELEGAVNAPTLNEPDIRAKAQQLAGLEGDLALARAVRLSKLRNFLSAEQVSRLSIPQAGQRPYANSLMRSPGMRPGVARVPGPLPQTNAPAVPAPQPAPAVEPK